MAGPAAGGPPERGPANRLQPLIEVFFVRPIVLVGGVGFCSGLFEQAFEHVFELLIQHTSNKSARLVPSRAWGQRVFATEGGGGLGASGVFVTERGRSS